ncbi:MAG: dUTP diphosphatase [Candidatus Carbobacillus altaicus]|uniref:dUTP diphosphatase n=1 Tax=Candidatus Carbonibacillus altaicus TaxID=2163959 RepID=A0A2R6Y196_9BACL|nr:dUTP diphosphatase [Candidatus Carbobacillus altaicus]PTQ56459.1 MAG: Deoxyuridine 5'-triphosphate nucleotidohydrolase [Candidatus Carbobacillus altaicus]
MSEKIETCLFSLEVGVRWLRKDRSPEGRLPFYATPGAAGMDLIACLDEPVVLKSHERALIPTGLSLVLPGPHVVALVFARSGQAYKRGLTMGNGVGVIDSDYTGELKVLVINQDPEQAIEIVDGERIAQVLFMPVYRANPVWVEEAPETERGEGGFGSTGFHLT